MAPGTVAYVFDGDTFLGAYQTAHQGPEVLIEVRYKGVVSSAISNGLDPEIVARVLLGELVRDDLAGRLKTSGKVAA